MISQLDANISRAISSLSLYSGRMVTMGNGSITLSFPDAYSLTDWTDEHDVRSRVTLDSPMTSLDHPVIISLRVSRPSLIGFVNAGYRIESCVAGLFPGEWFVLGEKTDDTRDPAYRQYVTWGCTVNVSDATSYAFTAGHYTQGLTKAQTSLFDRSRASINPPF